MSNKSLDIIGNGEISTRLRKLAEKVIWAEKLSKKVSEIEQSNKRKNKDIEELDNQ